MGVLLAHGTGPGHDLPVPLFYAIAGGALAVFATFLAASMLWPESRLRGASAGRPLPVAHLIVDSPAIRWVARLVVLALTVCVVATAAAGPDDPHENPAASYIYGVFWVGLAVVSVLIGPVWRVLNPLRTVHELACRAFRRDPAAGLLAIPGRLRHGDAFVLGVIAAHDRAVRLFEPRAAVSGQVPMMALMVLVTIGGLTLLAVG